VVPCLSKNDAVGAAGGSGIGRDATGGIVDLPRIPGSRPQFARGIVGGNNPAILAAGSEQAIGSGLIHPAHKPECFRPPEKRGLARYVFGKPKTSPAADGPFLLALFPVAGVAVCAQVRPASGLDFARRLSAPPDVDRSRHRHRR
jgi:hypothetical protein